MWYARTDFHQTFVSSASWDSDELTRFEVKKVIGQGHSMTKYVKISFWGLFLQYLLDALMDFLQAFVAGASWDKAEVVRFWGQRSGSQHDQGPSGWRHKKLNIRILYYFHHRLASGEGIVMLGVCMCVCLPSCML